MSSARSPGASPIWHMTRAQGPASSAARIARRRGSRPFTPTTLTLSRTLTPRQNSGLAATARGAVLDLGVVDVEHLGHREAREPEVGDVDEGVDAGARLASHVALEGGDVVGAGIARRDGSGGAGERRELVGRDADGRAYGKTWVWKSTRPGVTIMPVASSRRSARSSGIASSIAAMVPPRMPRSRRARRPWLGSITSPPLITRSKLRGSSCATTDPGRAAARAASDPAPIISVLRDGVMAFLPGIGRREHATGRPPAQPTSGGRGRRAPLGAVQRARRDRHRGRGSLMPGSTCRRERPPRAPGEDPP